jgi:SAM-dependent methyltransferase
MVDLRSISSGLVLKEDGIWYSSAQQAVSYPSEGNQNCFSIEDSSFWFRHRNQCIACVVQAYPPPAGGSIFDIGGGNGFVSRGLIHSGFEAVLVEPGPQGVANAKRRGLPHVVCATPETAGFRPGSLPAVGLFDVVEHTQDDVAFLQSIRRLMVDGGRLYVTVPAYAMLWSEEDDLSGHFRRYTLKVLCQTLHSAGFDIAFASYIFRFLPIPILLLRSLPYHLGLSKVEKPAANLSREHIVKSGVTSRMLEAVLRSELNQLKKNVPLRFGGSCLVAANAVASK